MAKLKKINILSLSIIIFLGTLFFVVFFKVPRLYKSFADFRTKNKEFKSLEKDQKLLAGLLVILDKNKDNFQKIDLLIPDSFNASALFAKIEDLSQKSGLLVQDLSIKSEELKPQSKQGLFSKKILRVELKGNFSSFESFLREIEWYMPLMDVIDLNFSATADGNFNFIANIATYSL